MIKKSGICAGVSMLAAMLLCLGSVSASETPTPEQVAAAGVQASDLEKIKLAPGGWWNDAPEFNGRLYTSLGPPPVEVFVMTHVFGLPDNDPSGVATALSLYGDASATKAKFDQSAGLDKQNFGNLVDGPSVGDQSRYMRRAGDSNNSALAAVRFRYGKYLVRIDTAGKAAELSTQTLAGLAKVVIGRLDSLEAGELSPPSLPQVAKRLPLADESAGPIMGTAGLVSDSQAWVHKSDGSLVISPKLRTLVDKGIKEGVTRRYVVTAQPDNVLDLSIVEFRNDRTAQQYSVADRKEDQTPWTEKPTLVKSAGPNQNSYYLTQFIIGRWGVAIVCDNPYKPRPDSAPASACVNASQHMEERVKQNLAGS